MKIDQDLRCALRSSYRVQARAQDRWIQEDTAKRKAVQDFLKAHPQHAATVKSQLAIVRQAKKAAGIALKLKKSESEEGYSKKPKVKSQSKTSKPISGQKRIY